MISAHTYALTSASGSAAMHMCLWLTATSVLSPDISFSIISTFWSLVKAELL